MLLTISRSKTSYKTFGIVVTVFLLSFFTVITTFKALNSKSYDVRDFNINGDGLSDESAMIQGLLDSANENDTIFFPAGRYVIGKTLRIDKGVTIRGGPGTVFDASRTTEDIFRINPDGYEDSTLSLVRDASEGDDSLMVADPSAYNLGDYIKIVDDEKIDIFPKGEIVRVSGAGQNTVNLEKGVTGNYTTDRHAYIRKLRLVENVTIEGIEFIGPGEETEPMLLMAYLVKNLNFNNCQVKRFGHAAVAMLDCQESIVNSSTFESVFKTGLGYSVYIGNASSDIEVSNCRFQLKGRHYIACGAATGDKINGGFPKKITVHDNYFSNSTQEAINTHPPFEGPLVINHNTFSDCDKGIDLTNGKSLITNNTFNNCVRGVQLFGNDVSHILEDNLFVNNEIGIYLNACNIEVVKNQLINSRLVLEEPINCTIRGNKIVDLKTKENNPIEVSGSQSNLGSSVRVENNVIKNCASEYSIKNYYIDNLEILNNQIEKSGNIYVNSSRGIEIIGNVSVDSNSSGIHLDNSEGIIIKNNIIRNPAEEPIIVDKPSPIDINPIIENNSIL